MGGDGQQSVHLLDVGKLKCVCGVCVCIFLTYIVGRIVGLLWVGMHHLT